MTSEKIIIPFSEALEVPTFITSVIAIFVYVGAEVSIGSYLVDFIMSQILLD